MGGASRFIMLLTAPFSPLLNRFSSPIFLRPITRRLSTTTRHLTFSSPTSHIHHVILLPHIKSSLSHRQLHAHALNSHSETTSSPYKVDHHPWPEWSHLINTILSSQGNLSPAAEDRGILPEDAFVVSEEKELSDKFIGAASVCLAFSRARPNLLRLLSMRDIEVIVTNGTPFLFESALDTARRMRAYLGIEGGNVLESDTANTVDIMKYILSYASDPSMPSEYNNLCSGELVESSLRYLIRQMTDVSFGDPALKRPASEHQLHAGNEHTPKHLGQNVEMKRGDWICPKCSFMNFARNFKCLECEEPRPKRQLTGREWQCPQCNFFNYGRNLVCLRCDCKRPGEAAANNVHNMSGLGDMDVRVTEDEEKVNRWFNKVSEPDHANDLSNAAVNEVFPEIMTLRKGENRFVVSTRKTPLERRQANSQSGNSMGGISEGDTSQSPGTNKAFDSSMRQSLDQILGHSSPVSGIGDHSNANEENVEINSSALFPGSSPLEYRENVDLYGKSEGQTDKQNKDKEQAEKSEKWFQTMSELHSVKDLPSAISDEDFPEIMPTRKGDNRFVVSKKKDRSLTALACKREAAVEHAGNSKFVPFVPFPPGHFARKDTPAPEDIKSSSNPLTETYSSSSMADNFLEKLGDARHWVPKSNAVQETESQERSSGDWSSQFSGNLGPTLDGNSKQNSFTSQAIRNDSGYSSEQNVVTGGSPQLPNQNVRTGWTGKSLEGSAVKESDPLDMSEEAKTERWFRRVAQIKDISELSQIPDEDFPSIMPQRKGVNRFVVSKRKTPLERRLTTPKYKKNLPTVSSDPTKKDNDAK
ncbi:hypothetical protein ACH5RR_006828 [Cinchona calisaya]|uniref:RanBP2-type domain-containing protein n=1 Tax=Cinchona calisaya TaxID=153742 RepID=A0ABD3AQG3_9GENT